MNRRELATAISADLGAHGKEIEIRTVEEILISMTDVIAYAIRRKDRVVISNLCSFNPFAGKGRIHSPRGKTTPIPARNRVKVIWSRNFMNNILTGED